MRERGPARDCVRGINARCLRRVPKWPSTDRWPVGFRSQRVSQKFALSRESELATSLRRVAAQILYCAACPPGVIRRSGLSDCQRIAFREDAQTNEYPGPAPARFEQNPTLF